MKRTNTSKSMMLATTLGLFGTLFLSSGAAAQLENENAVGLPEVSPFDVGHDMANFVEPTNGSTALFEDTEGCLFVKRAFDGVSLEVTERCGWIEATPFNHYMPMPDSWFSFVAETGTAPSCDVAVQSKIGQVTEILVHQDCGEVYIDEYDTSTSTAPAVRSVVENGEGQWTLTSGSCEDDHPASWVVARVGRPLNEAVLIAGTPCDDLVTISAFDIRMIHLLPDEPTGPVLSIGFSELASQPDLGADHANILRLYWAAFDREPDVGGAEFWIDAFNTGSWPTLVRIGEHFAVSAEFLDTYGAASNTEFVDLLYQNTLGRAGDLDGRAFWIDALDNEERTRGEVLADFSFSPEFQRNHPLPSDS